MRVIRDRAKILLPTPRVAGALKAIIKSEKITIAAFGAAAPLALLSASMKRAGVKRTVALTHGHEVWWAKIFPFNLLLRRIGATVDNLTYLGEFTRAGISRALSSQAQSSLVKIAPGIDLQHFRPQDATKVRIELKLVDKKIIVCVGRLVHRKGQDRLIEAMPEIRKTVPQAHLVLIGQGPYRAELVALAKKLGVEESVSFIGRIDYHDLPKYLCMADIFAMPARSRFMGLEVEGLGIVYLEASACGLAVIVGSSGGAPDAVVDGKSGIVVDGKSTAKIAKAAIYLLNDSSISGAMGAYGREWIVDRWNWEIWSKEFELLLNK